MAPPKPGGKQTSKPVVTAPATIDNRPQSLQLETEMYGKSNYELEEIAIEAERQKDNPRALAAYLQLGQNEYSKLLGANNPPSIYGISDNDDPIEVIANIAAHASRAFDEFLKFTNTNNASDASVEFANHLVFQAVYTIKEAYRFMRSAKTEQEKRIAANNVSIYFQNQSEYIKPKNPDLQGILEPLNEALREAERYFEDYSNKPIAR